MKSGNRNDIKHKNIFIAQYKDICKQTKTYLCRPIYAPLAKYSSKTLFYKIPFNLFFTTTCFSPNETYIAKNIGVVELMVMEVDD